MEIAFLCLYFLRMITFFKGGISIIISLKFIIKYSFILLIFEQTRIRCQMAVPQKVFNQININDKSK